MTRKDYEALADLIAEHRTYFKSNTAHAQFAADTAKVLADDNPRFDRVRFIEACMPRFLVGSPRSNVWELAKRRSA